MDSCDRRIRAYKNGKTMDESKVLAESLNPGFKKWNIRCSWSWWTNLQTNFEISS